ncbi:MAG TPA: molybdenum cofactor guanylyltransferase [Tepidisphaeraceae bacterium]|nr:molybdenum cofactor guanylyltransferase [Tepidisphaeraceae bacterium]
MTPPVSATRSPSVTLAVLAGGRGSRMGQAKGGLVIAGEPILRRLHRRLGWQGPTLLVTAIGRERPPGCELFGCECQDAVADEGPLRGVHTALTHSRPGDVVMLPVDMPRVEAAHLRWLAGQLASRPEVLGVLVRRPDGGVEPLPLAIRTTAVDVVGERLATGRRSVRQLAEVPGFAIVDAPGDWPANVWDDLDTPADVEQFHATSAANGGGGKGSVDITPPPAPPPPPGTGR